MPKSPRAGNPEAVNVVSNVPLAEMMKSDPPASRAGPAPAFQNAPPLPLGVTFRTDRMASVASSKAMIQPVYGLASQCEPHAVYSTPPETSSADRSL